MKKIKLTQGKFALVDDEDFEYLNQWKWYATKSRSTFYAMRKEWSRVFKKDSTILMHRQICKTKARMITDHKDHNGLNNQKENIRTCTHGQNQKNRTATTGRSSKYLGVFWFAARKHWVARINNKYKSFYLGSFKKEKDAARAYNEAAIKYHKEFANLNKV